MSALGSLHGFTLAARSCRTATELTIVEYGDWKKAFSMCAGGGAIVFH